LTIHTSFHTWYDQLPGCRNFITALDAVAQARARFDLTTHISNGVQMHMYGMKLTQLFFSHVVHEIDVIVHVRLQ
jgi:hypothetical protein